MELLYKYREFSENTDKIILNSELYFAPHESFNDPFDCNLEFKRLDSYTDEEFAIFCKKEDIKNRTKDEFLNLLKNKLISTKVETGILCMSENSKNILMWSHYANHHKGLCFGFEDGFYNRNEIIYEKVNYSENEEYEMISFLNPLDEEIKRGYISKSKLWEYEKEIRLIDLKSEKRIGAKKFNKKFLKEIIFGCKTDEINIKKIIQLCQLNEFKHVVFKKARIVPGKFELYFDEIDKSQYL